MEVHTAKKNEIYDKIKTSVHLICGNLCICYGTVIEKKTTMFTN